VPFSIFHGRWSDAQLSLKWQDQWGVLQDSPSLLNFHILCLRLAQLCKVNLVNELGISLARNFGQTNNSENKAEKIQVPRPLRVPTAFVSAGGEAQKKGNVH